jgi:hypothetical protein
MGKTNLFLPAFNIIKKTNTFAVYHYIVHQISNFGKTLPRIKGNAEAISVTERLQQILFLFNLTNRVSSAHARSGSAVIPVQHPPLTVLR